MTLPSPISGAPLRVLIVSCANIAGRFDERRPTGDISLTHVGDFPKTCDLFFAVQRLSRGTGKASNLFLRSLYVVDSMRAGYLFTAENFHFIRPRQGIPPKHLAAVLNRNACARPCVALRRACSHVTTACCLCLHRRQNVYTLNTPNPQAPKYV